MTTPTSNPCGSRRVVTYAFAYVPGEIELCPECARSYSAATLGAVSRGLHSGACEGSITATPTSTPTIETIRDGDTRYRVVQRETDAAGIARDRTLGFVTRWHNRDGRVNTTGRAVFRGLPLALHTYADFETLDAAAAYVARVFLDR